jgi:hypothetical protein
MSKNVMSHYNTKTCSHNVAVNSYVGGIRLVVKEMWVGHNVELSDMG